MNNSKSHRLYEIANTLIPGGVNSPVRAFRSVGSEPFFVESAKGAYLSDIDGNHYLDYVASWGAIILGHAHDGLLEETIRVLRNGTSFGACHPYEIELAQTINEAFPSMERIRLVSSGTEAVMSAVRLARGFTGRDGIVKFRGCYHGHADSFLVKAGSGLATFGTPDSKGIPKDLARHTYIAEFNDIETVEGILDSNKDIACVILEPIMGNMGVILPEEGFLSHLRKLCSAKKIILIFDEVITGFRVGFGGAQALYDIHPDMTCLGKVIGGGFPIGAFGGRHDIMDLVAPLGEVYQAGTLSGNPVAVRSGLYVLRYLKENGQAYDILKRNGDLLKAGILEKARKYGIPYQINNTTGLFTGFFTEEKVTGYDGAAKSNKKMYESFFKGMLEEGLFFAPSQFEAAFLTLSHGNAELEKTFDAYEKVFKDIGGTL